MVVVAAVAMVDDRRGRESATSWVGKVVVRL